MNHDALDSVSIVRPGLVFQMLFVWFTLPHEVAVINDFQFSRRLLSPRQTLKSGEKKRTFRVFKKVCTILYC